MRIKNRKTLTGTVRGSNMAKSITVDVTRRVKHPMYGKYLTKTSRFMAHDEKNEANSGDRVQICEMRPLSKNKRWRLVQILERSRETSS